MKLCENDDLGACFQRLSWEKASLLWHQHWQSEGLRFVVEGFFHWLMIWLTQAKTWQERMEVVNT